MKTKWFITALYRSYQKVMAAGIVNLCDDMFSQQASGKLVNKICFEHVLREKA